MCCVRVKFDTVCIVESAYVTENVSCIFNNRQLHAEAETKVRNLVLAGIACGKDHSLDTAQTESAGNKDTVYITQHLIYIVYI